MAHMTVEARVVHELAATARTGARVHYLVARCFCIRELVEREIINAIVDLFSCKLLTQKGYSGIVRV